MRRLVDGIRLLLLSPEMVAALLPFVAHLYMPDWASVLVKPMKEGPTFGLAAAGLALAAAAFCYREGGDILEPSGAKAVLLEWPGYFMLKARVVASLAWCVAGIGAALAATWMVASDVAPKLGAAVLVAGVLAAAVSAATVALARYRIRELLPPK
jgi:hypothetical protein